jgi:hypothetical protein
MRRTRIIGLWLVDAPSRPREDTYFADRAEWLVRLRYDDLRGQWWQELATVLDDRLLIAVGKESEVPDLHKSVGQHMQEKPPNEFDGI